MIDCTVLFTDIVGSTPRWEATPELMRTLLRVHDDLLTALVDRHSGHVVKRTGDGLVARFDETDAAVACAVAIQLALPDAFDEHPDSLTVRIGLHAGRLEPRLGDLHGPAMNRGARIMAAAHGGQILVSDRVRDRCELADVAFRALGVHRLKGLLQPERIHQVQAAGLVGSFPPIRSLNATIGNLPLAPDGMVNRVAEIEQLATAVEVQRVITLAGPGGVGKTRLAVHCAHAAREHFPDGVWMVDLAQVHESDRVATTTAAALGLRATGGDDIADVVGRTLAERTMLVLIDNCEHLHDEVVGLVRRWLPGSASTLLCTSQRRLGVAGELVVRVDPLHVPEHQTADLPPAVQLFVQRAELADPSFRLDDTNRAVVSTICRELDGLPLAIELAAARCEVMDPVQIAQRLDERLSLLRDRRETDRHQTLRAAIEWSYDLAGADGQRLLRWLSVFHAPFTWESVAAVTGLDEVDVLDGLGDLLDRSLVTRSGSTFRLLDTVRRFAGLALETAGERPEAQLRHAEWMARRAAAAVDGPDIDVVVAWLDELSGLGADLRAALDTLLAVDPDRTAHLVIGLTDLWITRNQWAEGLEWLARCERAVTDVDLRLVLLGWMSGLGWSSGDNASAARWAEEAVDLAARLDRPFPALAGSRLAVHYAFAGRADDARDVALRTVEALRADPTEAGRLLGPVGVALAVIGDVALGVSLADEGVDRAVHVGVLRSTTARMNRMMITPGRRELADTARHVGAVCERTGRSHGQGQALLYEAGCALVEGRIGDVLAFSTQAIERFIAGNEWTAVVNTLDNLPDVLAPVAPEETVALVATIERMHRDLGQTGAPHHVAVRERLAVSLRAQLGDASYDAAAAAGAARTAADAIDRLRWLIDATASTSHRAAPPTATAETNGDDHQ
jgi:predicted ATPase/class 3 adenylate cyclase